MSYPRLNTDRWIENAKELNFLEELKDEYGGLLRVPVKQVPPLTYFSNNIVHLLVVPALIASCFETRRTVTELYIADLCNSSWLFLKAEFFLKAEHSESVFRASVEAMLITGLLTRRNERLARPRGGTDAVSYTHLTLPTKA